MEQVFDEFLDSETYVENAPLIVGLLVICFIRMQLSVARVKRQKRFKPSSKGSGSRKVSYALVSILFEIRNEEKEIIGPAEAKFEQVITFYVLGHVLIHNRYFARYAPVDYEFPGGHAYRNRGSDRLFIRSGGARAEMYIFEYVSQEGWYRKVESYN